MSIRRNPFKELERLFDQMSDQFEDVSRWWEGEKRDRGIGTTSMAVDILDHDDEFVVTVDVPGFETEQIDVRLTDRTLHIEAERDVTVAEGDDDFVRRERSRRSMNRSIRLPAPVDPEAVSAVINNGVLTITLGKLAASEEARRIEIGDR